MLKMILDLTKETLYPIGYFFKSIMAYLGDILLFILPYLMLWIGGHSFEVGIELIIPLIVFFVVGIMNTLANKLNTGKRVPMPNDRFTEVDDDGEVSINVDRMQELILYMADLEDWLERKGYKR